MERPAGLAEGERYRCGACGNLTRFDVETEERVRRFWHLDLAGGGRPETTDALAVAVRAVTCRWCGERDRIEVVAVPAGAAAEARPARS